MATRNTTRGARLVRAGGNRPRTHPSPRSATPETLQRRSTGNELVSRDLRLLALRLEVIHRTAITVETALRYQNAENDIDFADCIRRRAPGNSSLQCPNRSS
jgi:hypothetical protein